VLSADATRHGIDLRKQIFDAGTEILIAVGTQPRAARSMIGKWRKIYTDDAVLRALRQAQKAQPSEPISYITACLKRSARAADTVLTAAEIEAEADEALAGVDFR
jgi:hypothetical protein